MPDLRRRNCQVCGKSAREVGLISWRGKCHECAKTRQEENIVGMATRSGEPFKRWRRAMAASVGGSLPLDTDGSNGKPSGDA